MFKRVELKHDRMWEAVWKSPLIVVVFVAPYLAGIMLSPTFADIVRVPEWLGVIWFSIIVAAVVYINGIFGSFFFGLTMFYFLNAVRMQNRWIYLLGGFAGGTFFNFLYPWYSQFFHNIKDFPLIGDQPLAEIAVASYPIVFGMCGLAVAWHFWRIISKGGEVGGH